MKNLTLVNKLVGLSAYVCAAFFMLYTNSSPYFGIIVMLGLLIFSLIINKNEEHENSLPVITATVFTGVHLLFKVVFFLFDRFILKILEWNLDAVKDALENSSSLEEMSTLTKNVSNLQEAISNDILGQILNIFLLLIGAALTVFAVFGVINILKGGNNKDSFPAKFIGKFLFK